MTFGLLWMVKFLNTIVENNNGTKKLLRRCKSAKRRDGVLLLQWEREVPTRVGVIDPEKHEVKYYSFYQEHKLEDVLADEPVVV